MVKRTDKIAEHLKMYQQRNVILNIIDKSRNDLEDLDGKIQETNGPKFYTSYGEEAAYIVNGKFYLFDSKDIDPKNVRDFVKWYLINRGFEIPKGL